MKKSNRTTRIKQSKALGGGQAKIRVNKYLKLEQENRQLKCQIESLNEEIARCHEKQKESTLIDAEAHRRDSIDRLFTQVERQDESLINLFAAATRLHADLDRTGVLTAIREILSDIVGCRALAIFEIDPARGVLSPVDCVNVQPDELSNICVGLGPIGKVAETGDFYLGGIADQNLLACIPLRITDRIVGAIAIFRLLEQKLELETGDHELLEWLSTQAGLALHRATLQAEWNAAIGVDG